MTSEMTLNGVPFPRGVGLELEEGMTVTPRAWLTVRVFESLEDYVRPRYLRRRPLKTGDRIHINGYLTHIEGAWEQLARANAFKVPA